MTVSKNNTRTLIMLPKDFKAKLEQLAKSENRTLSNYILTVLQKHAEKINSDRI